MFAGPAGGSGMMLLYFGPSRGSRYMSMVGKWDACGLVSRTASFFAVWTTPSSMAECPGAGIWYVTSPGRRLGSPRQTWM